MEHLFEQHHLIEIPMNKKKLTWHNRRIGDATLRRQLDCFLIKEDLLGTLSNFFQWVGFGAIFDHSPIYLELAGPTLKPREPFKLNSTWLQDPKYHKLVTDFWRDHPPSQGQNLVKGFSRNLMEPKNISIQWEKSKWSRDDQTLYVIEH